MIGKTLTVCIAFILCGYGIPNAQGQTLNKASSSSGLEINEPPKGFTALFNGRNLAGWRGRMDTQGNKPVMRSEMSDDEWSRKQSKADSIMYEHWSVHNDILYFDGKGYYNLVTDKDYGDFELLVDWRLVPQGERDGGIYLRGYPQVQIGDPTTHGHQGSGGLFNNKEHRRLPLATADNPMGEWNHFRIRMIGNRVTVHLNDQLVVDNEVMDNFWNRDKAINPTGPIELQAHNSPMYFKNIFIREISKNP